MRRQACSRVGAGLQIAVAIGLGVACGSGGHAPNDTTEPAAATTLTSALAPRGARGGRAGGGLPGAAAIAAGEHVWVGFDGGLARLDEQTGEVTAVMDASPGSVGGIAVTADAVWVRAEWRFLRRVDPATATVVEDSTAPEQSGGSVVAAFGSIWATASDDALYRLDPQAS